MKNCGKMLIPLLVGIVFCMWSCSSDSGKQRELATKVRVEKARLTDGNELLRYSGTIEESETIPHGFSAPGTVSRVLVSEGEFVRKGQLLASLDSSTYLNSYSMMQATQQQAEDAYKRLTPMHNNGNLPDIKYVEVETGLQKARAAAAIAKKTLDDCNLYATTDGYVSKRSIEPGSTAMPSFPSLTIVKINKVFARVSVPENEIASIHKGQKATISVGALGSAVYDGVVEEIGVAGDPMTHTYKIKIGTTNNDLRMKPGMICTTSISSPGSARAVVVPSSAVMVDETGKHFVYVISLEGKALQRYVVTGHLLDSGIEVQEGLQVNDAVVVAGQHKLIANASTQIVNE